MQTAIQSLAVQLQSLSTRALIDDYTLFNKLPCANVEPQINKSCPNPGKMACSACQLVSYCSKVGFSHPY